MFEKIIGNNKIKQLLSNTINSSKFVHSYMFVGTQGIGKKLFAEEFAKAILCENLNKCCDKCKSCIEFNSNNNPDFSILEPDGNSIKIEQIREMQKKVSENPIVSNKKVYIIDNGDKMTPEAQNCLLKTLEEPPEYITIILIGNNENGFLETIKSRCTIFYFENIDNQDILKYLKNNLNIENVDVKLINMFQGSISKAIDVMDKHELYITINNLFDNIKKYNLIEFMNCSQVIYENKENINDILENINNILVDKIENIRYAKCIDIIENTKNRLNANSNFDMCIDNMLLNIWEEINEKNNRG